MTARKILNIEERDKPIEDIASVREGNPALPGLTAAEKRRAGIEAESRNTALQRITSGLLSGGRGALLKRARRTLLFNE